MNRQMTLAEIYDELGTARTNKKRFLDKLESIIPWETLQSGACFFNNKKYFQIS